jgi:hypothetical protein
MLFAVVMALIGVMAHGADQTALDADRALVQAVAASDKAAVGRLLDPEARWTDRAGNTRDKTAAVAHLPSSTAGDAGAESHTYGDVVMVRAQDGKLHVLRVWAKRPAGWRLLVYHEVKQAEKEGPPSAAAPVKECVNPCKTVPYQPKNAAEAGVIKSWQALETAVSVGDAQTWAQHFADEFVVIRSGGTEPVTKQGRIAQLDRQKQEGTAGAPGQLAPGHTRMFTIGDTVVMTCQTTPHAGKPSHVTRVWVKRNGAWLMTVSFQTTIQSAPAVAGS